MMTLKVRVPGECARAELAEFEKLVREAGQVAGDGLESRIRKAHSLIFLYEDGNLIGTDAIKKPHYRYKRQLFERAGFLATETQYAFELGWVVVASSHRCKGLSGGLVEAALQEVRHKPLFATSRSDNERMHGTLRRFSFKNVGQPYPSTEEEDAEVLLFVRD